MKTSQDPRHLKRIKIMQDLFASGIYPKHKLRVTEAGKIIQDLGKIDKEIKKAAPTWPIDQINNLDLAILRLATFELIIKKEAPFKAVVDEAVELAKEFGAQSSPGFVNGVLGNIISAHKLDQGKKV